MAEYIDAKYLFKCNTCTHCRNGRCNTYCDHFECYTPDLNLIHAADVVEVRHGEWKPIVIQESYFDPPYCDTCKCSMCEYEIDVSETVYNYCPNCGAKMDGKDGAE